MRAHYKIFRGRLASWDELFSQAARFASELGELRLINISHACDGNDGTVSVWYWADESDGSDAEVG